MAAVSTRLRGLREAVRALRRLDRRLANELIGELAKAAEPVAAATRRKLSSDVPTASTSTVRVVKARSSIAVRQHKRKTSGLRPEFGSLQMRRAFLPALEEHADDVVDGVEDALDRWTYQEGF